MQLDNRINLTIFLTDHKEICFSSQRKGGVHSIADDKAQFYSRIHGAAKQLLYQGEWKL